VATTLVEGSIFGEENVGDPMADLYSLICNDSSASNFPMLLFLKDLAEELSVQGSLPTVGLPKD
jgi:hypothetical protein